MVLRSCSTMPLVCGERAPVRCGAGAGNVFHRQIQLIFVKLGVAEVFGAPIGQHARGPDAVAVEERYDPIVEQVGSRQRCLAVVEFCERYLRVSVDKAY